MIKVIGGRLFQWDISRTVIVKARTVKINEIHFAHPDDTEALVVAAKAANLEGYYTAEIPNILLQSGENIIVYAVGDDMTIGRCTFNVIDREKPADYVYTETEIKRWEDVVAISNEAIKTAKSVEERANNGEFKGEKGEKGDQGIQGIQGVQGEKGDKGEKGETGPRGPQGIQGEKGEKGDVGPQGIQGPKGEKGEKGDTGEVSLAYANDTFAPAIKNTLSGEFIIANDVSPTEHNLKVKLTSDTLEDFSQVSVSRYGKNLIATNCVDFPTVNKTIWEGRITGDLRISWKHNLTGYTNPSAGCINWYFEDGTSAGGARIDREAVGSYKISGTLLKVEVVNWCGASGGSIYDIQLEAGTVQTPFEPYVEKQTATANADGTVEGLTSISPNMTLLTDTNGAVINLEYNADTKMYIDNKLAELSAAILNT